MTAWPVVFQEMCSMPIMWRRWQLAGSSSGVLAGGFGVVAPEGSLKWLYEAEGMSRSWWGQPGVQVAFGREEGSRRARFVAVMCPISVTSWLAAPRARSSPAEPRRGCGAAGVNPHHLPARPPSSLPPPRNFLKHPPKKWEYNNN